MQRQPRTPQEAAMLDPLGLSNIAPNRPRGIFGGGRRTFRFSPGSLMPGAEYGTDPGTGAPPISAAPQPPADWQNIVGPELLANLSQIDPYASRGIGAGSGVNGSPATVLQSDAMPPAPTRPRGLIAPPRTVGASIDKIDNHGATLGETLNSGMGGGKKGGFNWHMAAGILGDALLGLNGQAPIYAQNMWRLRQQRQEHDDRLAQMREQTRLKLTEPEYRSVNNRLVRFTPGTGESDVLYTAPQDFEDYAATLGAEPGTPEYDRLVQDYVLRGSGPTATDNYNIREDHRQDNREDLEGIRQNNRIGLQDRRQAGQRALKATPTYRQANPLPPRSGRGGGSGGVREGQTATNPQTGAKVVYRGGKWVPLK